VTGGSYYTFSDWYKSNISSAISVEYWTAGQDTSGDGTWANLFSGIAPASNWTQYQTGFTMPPGAVAATFVHFIAGVGYLQTDDYSLTQETTPPGFSAPMVSLTFDDGSAGFYANALPLVNQKGFKTTQYIPTGCEPPATTQCGLGSDPFMMTKAQVTEIAGQGHEIGSHSVTHPDLTTVKSDSQLASEFTQSKATLEAIPGVGKVTDFAYPFGTYDARVIAAEQAAGYASGRSVEEGYNSKLDLQPYDIRVQNMLPTTTVAQFQGWIDYAKAHNYWLVIVYHEVQPDNTPVCQNPDGLPGLPDDPDPCIGPYDTTVSNFQAQLNYIASSGLGPDVKTVRDALKSVDTQTKGPSGGKVAITATGPATTGSVLTATPSDFSDAGGLQLKYAYTWTVDGQPVSGATDATGTKFTVPPVKHGQTITVSVVASDGTYTSDWPVTASVTVPNSAPTAGTVAITPANPAAGQSLTATPTGFADLDGDQLSYQYTWTVNGNTIAGATGNTFDTTSVVSGPVSVQVAATDGQGGTSPVAPASVTVIGYPKAGTVSISPAAPTTNQTVTANPTGFTDPQGDLLTYSYQWSVNGAPVAGATSKTFDLSQPGHGDRGQTVRVDLTATNAHNLASTTVGAEVTVVNAAPSADSVAIAPIDPKEGTDLTATPSFTDADGDTLTYQYVWLENGQQITQNATGILGGAWVHAGAVVSVQVTANDGHGGTSQIASPPVTVVGGPVAGTVNVSPTDPGTNQMLTANTAGFTDPQNEQLSFSYQWLVNGTPVAGATGKTFDLSQPGHGDHGDKVAVKVQATNPHGLKSIEVSDQVTVANTPPTSGSVAITPQAPVAGTALTATTTGFADADGDGLTYQYSWFENGQAIALGTGSTLPGSEVLAGTVTVQVTALDGHGATSPVASALVTVAPAPKPGGDTPAPGGGGGTPAPGPGLGTDNSPLKIEVSKPDRPFYRLGTSLILRYSCSAGAGVANCSATLGAVGAKSTAVSSGKKVQLSKTGRYALRVTATDASGKTAATTVYYQVTSDRNPPATVITSPKGARYLLGQFLSVRFLCSDPSGVAGCSATLGPTGGKASKVTSGSKVRLSKRGRYALRITARDGVGNAGSRTLYFSVR
jgi:peptidoglycan/xylan/chitin deacetylase (PgdA/CDA1 family)